MLNGVIIVNKEKGMTSNKVVAKMRGISKQRKIGHTGTLDPDATGVLPVVLGSATKLCDMLNDRTKEYLAELRLGVVTDTQDMTGTVLKESPVEVSKEEVKNAIMSFLGGYDQIPPMYSAVWVNGQRLYDLARKGIEVERKPRHVDITNICIESIELPVVRFRVEVSKGTYIRTLCNDIGEKLGCGGAMQSLVRTRVSGYSLKDAHTLSELENIRDNACGGLLSVLIPVESAFEDLEVVTCNEKATVWLENGNAFDVNSTVGSPKCIDGVNVRVHKADGSFVGLYAYNGKEKRFKPVKMFLDRED